jgi:ubiquinone/menaquinone biosynthesis C-methylase UbiE
VVLVSVELGDQDWRLLAHHRFKETERKRMVEDLRLEPGNRVLDLGCGIGLWCRWLAEGVAPDGCVVCLDVSLASNRVARKRMKREPQSDRVEYAVGDASAIPFGSRSFDVLFGANTLEYFADPCSYLQEMKRVVRRGGKVAVKDIDAGHMALYPVNPELMAHITLAMTRLVQHRRSNPGEDAGRVLDFFAGRKLHSYFQRAGFESITTKSHVIERAQPLHRMAKRHLEGLGELWLSELVPFLSARHLAGLRRLFDDTSEEFLLSRSDFYYFDAETLTVGIV